MATVFKQIGMGVVEKVPPLFDIEIICVRHGYVNGKRDLWAMSLSFIGRNKNYIVKKDLLAK